MFRCACVHVALMLVLAIPSDGGAVTEPEFSCASEPADTEVNYGQRLVCAIGSPGDSDIFRFDGVAADRVFVQVIRTGGDAPCVSLRRPDGTELAGACQGFFGEQPALEVVLEQSGKHAIIVTQGGGTGTMDYKMLLERLTPLAESAVPLCSGCQAEDEISPAPDLDFHAFNGFSGSRVNILASRLSGDGLCVSLRRPDGTQIAGACQGFFGENPGFEVVLDQDGPYEIITSVGGNTGTAAYRISLQCITGPCPTNIDDPPVDLSQIELPGDEASGINGVGGWKCIQRGEIEIAFDGGPRRVAAGMLPRGDTATTCKNDGLNGFLLVLNYALLGPGPHVARFYDDGVQFAEKTFTVATLGPPFAPFTPDLSAEYDLVGFPVSGKVTTIKWRTEIQGFAIVRTEDR